MEYLKIDGQIFYDMMINAYNKLDEQKDFVNSLNVFPVPDGDTGTNMSMTLKGAVTEIDGMNKENIGELSKKLAKGALMGARGNSGVILSQILRGFSKGFEGKTEADSIEFANCIAEGSKSAYKAVMRPTEGTILSVIRAAGECAVKSSEKNITDLLKEICDAAEIMLNKTPDMLPVLKKAKVVNAGGAGLLIILKSMYETLSENIHDISINNSDEGTVINAAAELGKTEIKFGYCTEFIIMAKENADVNSFKSSIEPMGDCMLVVSSDDVVKVHIHTNDPGAVLSEAVKIGELTKVKIDNMREEHRHILDMAQTSADTKKGESLETESKKYAFISVAIGGGIKDIFKDLGCDKVIEGGQTMNPSTQDILDSINNINADNILILPNNKNIQMAANQAAQLSDKNVTVIPTATIPQGITAITVFNSELDFQKNIENIESAIKNVKTGLVTYAVRNTDIDGKAISEGDILGIAGNNILETGKDIFEVCENLIDDMVNESNELITLFYGQDCDETKVQDLVSKISDKYPEIDVQCYNGKQPIYYFILSAE